MELLPILNEWWETGTISKEKAKEYKRKAFENIKTTFFKYKQILILNGLRRVGKTTIIYQLIEELLKNKRIDPKNILYFSFDEMVEDPIKILDAYSKVTKVDWKKEECFIFFDEIQKLNNWSSKIKLLYDNFPKLKICLSGSASPAIEKEAVTDLAGRYFSEYISVLSLQEFAELYLGKRIDNVELYEPELKRLLEDYIRRPFPEIVRWDDELKVNHYIKELIIQKLVNTDIPETFKDVNVSLLSTLTEIFMKEPGMILDMTSLAKELGIHKLTLAKHISFLEFGNLITVVKNFRPSIRAESRKLRKVYPYHISLSFCFYPELSKGQIYECLVQSALGLNKYWRKGEKEIDFLKVNKEIIPIEVKAKENIVARDIRNLIYFTKRYKPKKAAVVYTGEEGNLRIDNKQVALIPIHKLLFNFSLENIE